MSKMPCFATWTVAVWFLAVSGVFAEEKPIHVGEAAIEKALAEPTQLEFVDTPLKDVLDFLKDTHRIEIQLDQKALGGVGIGTDTPITINLKEVPLRSALNLLLKPLSLAWAIQDEVLLITTSEEADLQLTTKVYDVSDLVGCFNTDDEPWDDYDTLILAITGVVKPNTWYDVGGPGSIVGASLGKAKILAVSQTYEAHREIEKFLANIREVAAKHSDTEPPRRDKSIADTKSEMPKWCGGPAFTDGSSINKPNQLDAIPAAAERQKKTK